MEDGKTIVLGIDALNDKLIGLEELKGLRRFFDRNLSTTLLSVHPPTTDAAWTSFQTGVTPDEHGICGFVDFENEEQPLFSRKDIDFPTFYDIINRKGKRTFLFNLPFTYPPSIDGDIVYSWVDRGFDEKKPYYPKDLNQKYPSVVNIDLFPDCSGTPTENLRNMILFFKKRLKFIEEVLDNDSYDLYFFLLSVTDWIQHNCYYDLTQGKKNQKTKIAKRILKDLDDFFIKLVKRLDFEKDVLIVLSDHGFEARNKVFNINTWLMQNGYLKLSKKGKSLSNVMRTRVIKENKKKVHLGSAGNWLREHENIRNSLSFLEIFLKKNLNMDFSTEQKIDIEHSKAICFSKLSQSVFINENSKFKKEKIKKSIINGLNELDGVKAFDIDMIFEGSKRNKLGDIFVRFDGAISRRIEMQIFQRKLIQKHSYRGVICMAGKPFKKCFEDELQITDFFPIILNIYDCEIPKYIKNKIPKDIFVEDHLLNHPIKIKKDERGLIKRFSYE